MAKGNGFVKALFFLSKDRSQSSSKDGVYRGKPLEAKLLSTEKSQANADVAQ